jgi:hypothetical protein
MAQESYCTLAELRSALSWPSGDTSLDSFMQTCIDDAARAIEDECGRRFWADDDANQTRKFLPENSGMCLIDDLITFTSLTTQLDSSPWTVDVDFYFLPINAAADGQPYTAIKTITRPFLFTRADIPAGWSMLDGRITLTGKYGWETTPGPVHRANLILAERLFKRREAPFGLASAGVDTTAVRLSRSDPDVAAMLTPYSLTMFA